MYGCVANARSAGSCTLLRTIHEIAASTIVARQAAKNAFTEASPEVSALLERTYHQRAIILRTVHQGFRSSSASLAILVAIRRASSRVS